MSCLIGFGRWSPYYYYILVSMLARFIKEDILGLGADIPISNDLRTMITRHPIATLLLGYSSDFIISLIIIIYMFIKNIKKNEEKENLSKQSSLDTENSMDKSDTKNTLIINYNNDVISNEENKKTDSNNKFELIHNDLAEIKIEIIKKNSFKFIIISACLILIKEIFIELIYSTNDIFDYYFLNLIVIALILRFFLKEKIYNHQILAIISVIVISGSFYIGCLFASKNTDKDNKDNINYGFQDKIHLVFILFFCYIFISISFCTGILFQKNLMQFKFVSPSKLLFWKGAIGVFLCIIGLIISTNVPCKNQRRPTHLRPRPSDREHHGPRPGYKRRNDTNNNMTLEVFVCSNVYENETYFDNILSYFAFLSGDLKGRRRNNTNNTKDNNDDDIKDNIIKEVFILLGYFIFHFISELSLILVNKFLTPIHYLITESLYNLIHIPCEMITKYYFMQNNDINEEDIQNDYRIVYNIYSKNETTRILKLIAIFFEFLGYLIYMEIIQLNFCGLNRNVVKSIQERAKIEYRVDNLSESDYNINDFDNDNDESSKS